MSPAAATTARSARLNIELFGYWLHATGSGRRGGEDRICQRDPATGLPMIARRALRGLVREAVQLAEDFGHVPSGSTTQLFGGNAPDSEQEPQGCLGFGDALPDLQGVSAAAIEGLFETISSTAIDEATHVAREKTLRTAEVALPVPLAASVHLLAVGADSDGAFHTLEKSLPLLRRLGSMRHRGFGRCQIKLERHHAAPEAGVDASTTDLGVSRQEMEPSAIPSEVWMEITLKSPVILTATGVTTGGHESLDFIPGATLMGAVAARGFSQIGAAALLGGLIRFGDGNPLSPSGKVGLPIPLSFHDFKGDSSVAVTNGLDLDQGKIESFANSGKQLQQMRRGYVTVGGELFQVPIETMQGSAIDRDRFDRPWDGRFYGFERIKAGMKFVSRIEFDASLPQDTRAEVVKMLRGGGIRLGRSHANYGEAEIRLLEVAPQLPFTKDSGNEESAQMIIYACSDLHLSRDGQPTLWPSREHFGLDPTWNYKASSSFVRTRAYSPWNFFFGCREPERQVISRGSVLVFSKAGNPDAGAGQHRHHSTHTGLGDFVPNPDMVLRPPSNLSECSFPAGPCAASVSVGARNGLAEMLEARAVARETAAAARGLGRCWADEWLSEFSRHDRKAVKEQLPGKSQWSAVLELATKAYPSVSALQQAVHSYCSESTRRRRWTGESPARFLDKIERALNQNGLEPSLAAPALAEAARRMRAGLRQQRDE